jgi:hypothetical protein
MQKLSFSHQWVQWIMSCVTTVRYSELFWICFQRRRGLRQGDILSPLLFFCGWWFICYATCRCGQQAITPVKVCPRALGVSHLLFADDTLLFLKAEEREAESTSKIIDTYARASGQLINLNKWYIMFGKPCPEQTQDKIKGIPQL